MEKLFFSFLIFSGCRRGEASALTWNDLDFERRSVKISKTVNRHGLNKGQYEFTSPKNRYSVREIILPDNLLQLLADYKHECEHIDGFSENAFVFGIYKPIIENTMLTHFHKYTEALGLKRIRLHDLRHLHASLLAYHGASPMVVAARLGHSDIKQTLNTYSHFFPLEQQRAVEALNLAF